MVPFYEGCALPTIPHGANLLVADKRSWYNEARADSFSAFRHVECQTPMRRHKNRITYRII